MGEWQILFEILILLGSALLLGTICERFRQSAIVGYLAAGTIVGPHALGLIRDGGEVSAVAELGVALLLFTIGLEFSWQRLRSLGTAALGGGTAQVMLTMAVAASIGMACGLPARSAWAVGGILALSSTASVMRLLIFRSEVESVHGRHSLGILLLQDIAVVPLVLLVTVLGGEGSLSTILLDVLVTLAWALGLILVLYVLLSHVVPRFLNLASVQRNRDLPILLGVVTGLGSAAGAHSLGLSPALGAFVAGMLLAESPFALQIRTDVASLRTLLVTLFFSSIGMLGDPEWFLHHIPLVLGMVMAVVIGKALLIWLILRRFGLAHSHALAAGLCLAQIGEFSFVLIALGRGNLFDEGLFALLISATLTTLFLTPYLVEYAPRIATEVLAGLRKWRLLGPSQESARVSRARQQAHLILIGYGPAGQAVGDSLLHLGKIVSVIDLNQQLLRKAKERGFDPHLGDAMHADALLHLGVAHASAVVVTIPDPTSARVIIGLVRTLAPQVPIIARSRYHRQMADLLLEGADHVADEERLVGIRLAALLRKTFAEKALPTPPAQAIS